MILGMGAVLAPMIASAMVMAQAGPEKVTAVTFAKDANRHPVSGFGGEWDPHFWRSPNTKRGCDEKQWAVVCDRIRDIGIGRVRMSFMPDWYEPRKVTDDGKVGYTWDSESMQSMYRHLDYCQQNGIRVTLTWWCAPSRTADGTYWLACPGVKDWCSAPNEPDACAKNVVAGLRHLLVTRGYSCIDAFTFYNEPDWAFYDSENKVDFERYAATCRAIHRELEKAGLRKRLSLDLADAAIHKDWLEKCAQHLGGVADSFNVHSYVFTCDQPGYPAAIRAWVRQWLQQCGEKPLTTNELGTGNVKGAYSVTDLETFERAFLVAQYAILGLNEGMCGALFWGLYDQYYYDGQPEDGSNGGLMKTNLMGYVSEGWRLRPTAQAWTLVCHAAPVGAKVYPGRSEDGDIDAVALAGKEVNVLVVNRAKEPRSVRLVDLPVTGDKAPSSIRVFSRQGLSAQEVGAKGISLPAESVVLASFAK